MDGTPYVGIELVTLTYADGQEETYQVPVAYYAEPQERLEHAVIGQLGDRRPRSGARLRRDARP